MAVWWADFQTFLSIHIVSGKCYQMSSFSETKAQELIKSSAKDFAMHNVRQLSRIYPSGTRTGSSNYKPTPLWNVGCQIGVWSELLNK
jgi:phosphatidylinositol phospholipase C delta